jgi:hypothetical protein
MLKLMEFQLNLESTDEEAQRAAIRARENKEPIAIKVKMPDGANVLRAGTRINQREISGVHPQTKQIGRFMVNEEVACLWAEANDEYELVERTFFILANDVDIPRGYDAHKFGSVYIGTFLLGGGQLAFHVYGECNPIIRR